MAEGKRPGGLTALAVLNFVFSGLGLLGVFALLALIGAAKSAAGADFDKAMEESSVSSGLLYGLLLLTLVRMAVMLAAGVGYLKQKKFLGRTLGNLYAVLALLDTAIGLGAAHTGVSIGTIIGLIYPVLTLVLINTTFKDDLVN
jgi:hypothetical protein